MLCELDTQQGECAALRAVRSPFDRRSFLRCALASGAALGLTEFSAPAAGMPAAADAQRQEDAQFTVEAKFYQKLANRKIKCNL